MFPNEIKDIDNAKYICSIGLMKACDDNNIINYISPYELIIDWNKLINYGKDYSCVFVKMEKINEFIHFLDKISCKIILVIGDGDFTFPFDIINETNFINIINNNKIVKIYSTNCNVIIPTKIELIPIGVNFHCDAIWKNITIKNQEFLMESIRDNSLPFYERINKCYSNFHFSFYESFGNPRKRAIQKINQNLVFYEPNKIQIEETWKNQSKYSFVLSPHGNGLDCHRTWEALILGCAVIVKKSCLDSLYENLPVLIVNEWSDITEELLKDTLNKFKFMNFNYDKITLKYWVDKIHSIKFIL